MVEWLPTRNLKLKSGAVAEPGEILNLLIQDLFEEWDEPIPISIDYLEDEIELKATIININMHPKAIDFDMDDSEFDYDIDVEFLTSTSYRRTKIYGMTANYFVPAL